MKSPISSLDIPPRGPKENDALQNCGIESGKENELASNSAKLNRELVEGRKWYSDDNNLNSISKPKPSLNKVLQTYECARQLPIEGEMFKIYHLFWTRRVDCLIDFFISSREREHLQQACESTTDMTRTKSRMQEQIKVNICSLSPSMPHSPCQKTRPSHTWEKNILFYGCLRFSCLGLLSNCQSLLNIEAQELLLQHLFLGCNCIYKQFVETKKKCVQILRTSTVFFFIIKLQELEQNLIDIHSVMCD